MRHNPLEELPERVRHQFREIRIEVQMLADEPGVLRTEPVRERFGVDDVDEFVVRPAQFLAHQLVHAVRHVVPDVVGDHPLPEISAASFVTKDESAGIHIETLIAAIVEAGISARAQDGRKTGLPLEQSAA